MSYPPKNAKVHLISIDVGGGAYSTLMPQMAPQQWQLDLVEEWLAKCRLMVVEEEDASEFC